MIRNADVFRNRFEIRDEIFIESNRDLFLELCGIRIFPCCRRIVFFAHRMLLTVIFGFAARELKSHPKVAFQEFRRQLQQANFHASTFSRAGRACGDVGGFLQIDFVFWYACCLERIAYDERALLGDFGVLGRVAAWVYETA